MWRFIRRVFVLLILFTIIFLVYRYINPAWANNFLNKIKSVTNYFSSSTWDIVVVWDTTNITWDVNLEVLNEEWDLEWVVEDKELKEEWDGWLEELNKEIEEILGESEEESWGENWELGTENWEIEENIEEVQKEEEIESKDAVEPNASETEEQIEDKVEEPKEEKKWLSDLDYQQIKDVFGNLVE